MTIKNNDASEGSSHAIQSLVEFSRKVEHNPELAEICSKAVTKFLNEEMEYWEENKYALYRAAIDAEEIDAEMGDDIYKIVMINTTLDPEAPHPSVLNS